MFDTLRGLKIKKVKYSITSVNLFCHIRSINKPPMKSRWLRKVVVCVYVFFFCFFFVYFFCFCWFLSLISFQNVPLLKYEQPLKQKTMVLSLLENNFRNNVLLLPETIEGLVPDPPYREDGKARFST